jgi:hypothetical protein
MKKIIKTLRAVLAGLYAFLFGFVLHSFKSMNRKVRSRLPVWRMEEETFEHIHLLLKVFKWIVFPLSLLYVFVNFYFFGENALASTLWGILIFFYSNFLPDLPSIYRQTKKNKKTKDLPWYKKYAILVFAPFLIWFLFSGMQLGWKTTQTFHDFKSLTVYGVFLFILGFFAFVQFPISIGTIAKITSIPIYGAMGYLTHLKVDKIW